MNKILFLISIVTLLQSNSSFSKCAINFSLIVNDCLAANRDPVLADCRDRSSDIVLACLENVDNLPPAVAKDYTCGGGRAISLYEYCGAEDVPPPKNKSVHDNICPIGGSVVYPETLTYTESVDLVGVPFRLVYSSEKVKGRKDFYSIKIPLLKLTGNVPNTFVSNEVYVSILDRNFSFSYSSSVKSTDFYWDGKNASGEEVPGVHYASIALDRYYSDKCIMADIPPEGVLRLAQGTSFPNCIYFAPETAEQIYLGTIFNSTNMIGGWNFSIRHHYDNMREVLHLGSGETFSTSDIEKPNGIKWILSKDNSEIFVFDSNYNHIQTIDALLNIVNYTFTYDGQGKLVSISDKYGNQTSIQYSGDVPTLITSPYGQVSNLTVDENGYITSIIPPSNQSAHHMAYSSGGLLQSFQKPNGVTSTVTYNADGTLLSDISSSGHEVNLSKIITDHDKYTLNITSALGRTNSRKIEYANDVTFVTNFIPDGEVSSFSSDTKTKNVRVYGENYTRYENYLFDPRFLTRRLASYSLSDSGQNISGNFTESCDLSDSTDPFSFTTLTKTSSIGTKIWTSTFNSTTKETNYSSPVGRTSKIVLNNAGDISSVQNANFTPVQINYDSRGRISKISQSPDREYNLAYNSTNGLLNSITNPLNQIVSFTYNSDGRITKQTLPDGREIIFAYDASGNVIGITPPGRPVHVMNYEDEIMTSYAAPMLQQASNTTTLFSYNDDEQLIEITKPDGTSIDFTYGSITGNLDSIALPTGNRTFSWYKDKLTSSVSEDSISRSFSHIGTTVFTDSTSYGTFSSQIMNYYNSFLIPRSEVLRRGPINWELEFVHDNDGLLINVGNLSFTRSPTTGYISQTDLGDLTQFFDYSSTFGELSNIEAVHNGNNIYEETITRDNLGRVSTMDERYGNGTTKSFSFVYDAAGRLTEKKLNGSTVSKYNYDSNSNRIGQTINGETLSGGESSSSKVGFIDVGNAHTCSILEDGVKCWGRGVEGQLGYGNTQAIGNNETLTNSGFVSLGGTAKQIELGVNFSCALLNDGSVRCWGQNEVGQLGLGNLNYVGDNELPSSQSAINLGGEAKLLAVGNKHACAVKTNNEVVCWGMGTSGRLGYGNTNNIGDDEDPATIGVVNTGVTSEIIQISAGNGHTCILTTEGNVKCWGGNGFRQLGRIGQAIGDNEAPATISYISLGEPVKQIAAGAAHTCALTQSKKVKCWGQNDYGQLGLATTTNPVLLSSTLGYVDVGADVKYLSAGNDTTCVITVGDETKCWGRNNSGQLGLGHLNTIGDDEAPNTVPAINLGGGSVLVSTGIQHSCAIQTSGNVFCWGIGAGGRLGYGNTNTVGDDEVPYDVGVIPGVNLGSSGSSAAIVYDEQDRLLKFGTKTFTYNLNGDLLTETDGSGTKTFTYDVFGNLKKVELPSKIIDYSVDAHDRRVTKKENGTPTVHYIWNTSDQLVAITDGSGVFQARFIYGSKSHVPDYMSKNNIDYQIVTNHLGSPVAVVDSNTGTVAQEIVWDEWGNIISDSNPGFTPFGYAGCLYDVDTKLCRFGARDYDASIGRWLSKDPIMFAGGDTNLYGYVMQDPINFIDTNGLEAKDAAGAAHDFWRNYWDMKRKNVKNSDQYFHCMANCEASSRGQDGLDMAVKLSDGREYFDSKIKGDSSAVCEKDQLANFRGQMGGSQGQKCSAVCGVYKVNGL